MRWRVWMIVASVVRVVVATPAVLAKKRRIETALVVSSAPWSITLSTIVGADDRGGHLDAAGAPAIGQRHLAPSERHLIARHRHRLEDGAADHALGLLVEIGEVVAGGRRARSFRRLLPAASSRGAAAAAARARTGNRRNAAASDAARSPRPRRCRHGSARIPGPAPGHSPPRRARRARSARSTSAIAIALRSAPPKLSP